jgi:AcrR family transcriptional regulator
MVRLAGERGFAAVTVGAVCAHAKVSRATFYAMFDSLEGCFLAVIDDGYARVRAVIERAFADAHSWRAGLCDALAALLIMFDREPQLARVWFVETLAAGSWALERRERYIAALTSMIEERWPVPDTARANALAAPAVMESILGIIHTRQLARDPQPLIALLGPLMGLIGAHYLPPGAVAREMRRGDQLSRSLLEAQPRAAGERSSADARMGACEPVGVPPLLRSPRARRPRECLLYIAEQCRRGHRPSNRQIADAIGIARHDQISTLLSRLAAAGLIAKPPTRAGHANAWSLTPSGEQAARGIAQPDADDGESHVVLDKGRDAQWTRIRVNQVYAS